MLRSKSFLWMIGLLSFIIYACGAPSTPATMATIASSSPQPVLPTTTPVPTPEPIRVGALAIETIKQQDSLILISTLTGKKFEAYPPIPLGQNYSYTFSANGKTLALVSNGQLYFIDLPSWKYRRYDIDLHGWLSAIVYSPDESVLALANGGPDADLILVNTATGQITAQTHTGFSVRQIKFTNDGKALMVYGPQLAMTGEAANAEVSVGNPKAELLSLTGLSPIWSVELRGIRQGTFPKKTEATVTQDIYKPGAATHYEPGVAFSPTNNILYLVHGDEDKLTIVNFTDRNVQTVDIKAPATWFDQLLAWTADTASAKGMDGYTKQAVISPDGQYLYVVGSTETFTASTNGDVNMSQAYLGLQIIATEDGKLIKHQAVDAYSASLAPDKKKVLLTGWNNATNIPWMDIYDINSNTVVRHVDHVTPIIIHRMDGQTELISNEYYVNDTCHMATLDPKNWSMNNQWQGNCINWLTMP